MIDTVIEELKAEIDRSTLQVIAVPDPTARYLLPLDILTEVIKYLLGEFLIGLLGFEAMSAVGQRLHAAGQMARDWVANRQPPPPSEQAVLDAALEDAFQAATEKSIASRVLSSSSPCPSTASAGRVIK